jgi:hypothetical protein
MIGFCIGGIQTAAVRCSKTKMALTEASAIHES